MPIRSISSGLQGSSVAKGGESGKPDKVQAAIKEQQRYTMIELFFTFIFIFWGFKE